MISCSELEQGFGAIVALGDDIIVDVPKVWDYLAEMLGKCEITRQSTEN